MLVIVDVGHWVNPKFSTFSEWFHWSISYRRHRSLVHYIIAYVLVLDCSLYLFELIKIGDYSFYIDCFIDFQFFFKISRNSDFFVFQVKSFQFQGKKMLNFWVEGQHLSVFWSNKSCLYWSIIEIDHWLIANQLKSSIVDHLCGKSMNSSFVSLNNESKSSIMYNYLPF